MIYKALTSIKNQGVYTVTEQILEICRNYAD